MGSWLNGFLAKLIYFKEQMSRSRGLQLFLSQKLKYSETSVKNQLFPQKSTDRKHQLKLLILNSNLRFTYIIQGSIYSHYSKLLYI